jgi:hypothetical protein
MGLKEVYDYYGREDVQQALLRISKNREVVGVFRDGAFSTRPNTLVYPKDILMHVRSGAVAFHGSLERWSNPMTVGSENYESTRIGWDLILDLDCKKMEHGKVAAGIFMGTLRKHGVENFSIKFTGGTGFHIGVPFESFPPEVDYDSVAGQYPSLARKIVGYLRDFSKADLEKALLKKWTVEELAADAGRELGEVMSDDGIDPFRIVEVDPVLISPRHLFRMPYSLHEKSHLVSVPIDPSKLEGFTKDDARPEKADISRGFLGTHKSGEADLLVTEAVDWFGKQEVKRKEKLRREFVPENPVPLELAPPCIQNILKGVSDGKKRSLFILINYLSSLRWKWEDISELLVRWNEKNSPSLGENYIRGQIRWHANRKKSLPPPNCENAGYYADFGVCKPDAVCGWEKKTIKNPMNYALRKLKKGKDSGKKGSRKTSSRTRRTS